VELCVDRVGSDLAGVKLAPECDEAVVVLAAAEGARSMPCGQCRRFVEEEELGEAARSHERSAPPPAKSEPACDPALTVVATTDAAVLVVEAATVSVDEAARGICDQLAARRDSVLQGTSLSLASQMR
jgi:hypothetical protein